MNEDDVQVMLAVSEGKEYVQVTVKGTKAKQIEQPQQEKTQEEKDSLVSERKKEKRRSRSCGKRQRSQER